MSALGKKLRSAEGGYILFWCPGCDGAHMIRVASADRPGGWGFNGNAEKPTFTPSVKVTYPGSDAGVDGAPPAICHSFVTDGRVQFLADCTHARAGQTVDLPDFDEEYVT